MVHLWSNGIRSLRRHKYLSYLFTRKLVERKFLTPVGHSKNIILFISETAKKYASNQIYNCQCIHFICYNRCLKIDATQERILLFFIAGTPHPPQNIWKNIFNAWILKRLHPFWSSKFMSVWWSILTKNPILEKVTEKKTRFTWTDSIQETKLVTRPLLVAQFSLFLLHPEKKERQLGNNYQTKSKQ